MGSFLSPRFWLQTFMSTLFTMVCIWLIKKVCDKYNIPFLSTVASEV